MQRALELFDIFHLIVESIASPMPDFPGEFARSLKTGRDSKSESAQRDLANLALVSRMMSDLALDALWRDLPRPSLLFSLISNVSDISTKEWNRFRTYAGRVQKFKCWVRSTSDNLDLSLVLALARHNRMKPLLPNLQQIEWSQTRLSDFSAFLALVPPTLKCAAIDHYQDVQSYPEGFFYHQSLNHLLERLKFRSPALQELYIETNTVVPPSSVASFTLLTIVAIKWAGNREWSFALNPTTLQALSSLPKLETLEISGHDVNFSSSAGFEVVFPALRHLGFLNVHARPDQFLAFANAIVAPSLIELCFTNFRGLDPFAIRDVCSVITERFCETLRDITVGQSHYIENINETHFPSGPSLPDLIQPLLQLHELEHVKIDLWNFVFTFSDEGAETMALAWPKLKMFILEGLDEFPIEPRPSAELLLRFARHCPLLHTVELPNISSVIPKAPDPPFKHGLNWFYLGSDYGSESDKNSLLSLGVFLARIFPDMEIGGLW